jgi:protocatechuate 3,4-dioxygenase beta subunit
MRFRILSFILLASLGFFLTESADLLAKDNSPQQQVTLQQARILESINLLRSLHNQPALAFAKFARQPAQAATSINSNGAITGRLNGIASDAIRTAWVVAWSAADDSGRGDAGIGVVGSTGDYRITDLPAGDYYVLAAAEGYLPKFYKNVLNFSEATTVKVEDGSTTEGIDFDMEKIQPGTASISGIVAQEADGAPIHRAQVTVFSPDNPFLSGWAETSESGEYKITNLKTGKYYASAWAEGYLSEYFNNVPVLEQATLIDVVEPSERTNVDFSLIAGGSISGVVKNDEDVPIPGAYVQAMTFWFDSTFTNILGIGSYGWAVTNELGEYKIGGLSTGSYIVSAQVWRQWSYAIEWYDNATTPEEATPVPVEEGKETQNINFQLSLPVANGFIAGTVTDLQNLPIAGAFVQAQSSFNDSTYQPTIWAYAFTERDGSYIIPNLPDGSYLVSAAAQSGWQYVQRWWPDAESPDQAEPVIVDSAADPLPIDFHLPLLAGTASIAGTVKASAGRALAYAFIEISPAISAVDPGTNVQSSGIWAYGYTDSSGHYQVDNLPGGDYFAHAQYWEDLSYAQQWYDHADSRATATQVHLSDGDRRDDIDFDLTLRPIYGSIAGTVVNEVDDEAINHAYVEISPVGRNFWEGAPFVRWPYYAITNENGNYRLDWLPEGDYLFSVYANGAFEYFENAVVPELATPVKVTGGDTAAVNFGLTPRNEGMGIISGRVGAEYTDQLLEIAVVVAKPLSTLLIWPQSEMFFNTVINPDGTYEISGLPAGQYFVMCFAPDYLAEYYDNVYDPSQATTVNVDGITPTIGIDFALAPIYYLRSDEPGVIRQNGAAIFGKVTDFDGTALTGATIYLWNDAGQAVSSARSHADGTYEFLAVPPSSYRIQAGALGYVSQFNGNAGSLEEAQPINLGNGRLELDFALAPRTATGVDDGADSAIPKTIELYGNYPNPFNPETRISFGLPKTMRVKVRIFNLLGEEVAQLFDGTMSAGVKHLSWNGRNRFGNLVTSGLYFYRLETVNGAALVGKMLMMK